MQELKRYQSLSETYQFGVDVDLEKGFKDAVKTGTVTSVEAIFLALHVEKEMTLENKKKRFISQFEKLAGWSPL